MNGDNKAVSSNHRSLSATIPPEWFFGALGSLFVGAIVVGIVMEHLHDTEIVKYVGVMQIFLVVLAIIGISGYVARRPSRRQPSEEVDQWLARLMGQESDQWLIRLVITTALGMCIVVLYAVQWIDVSAIQVAGVGLLAAGATWLVGVVVGFLFGIPHIRQGETSSSLKSSSTPSAPNAPAPSLQDKAHIESQPSGLDDGTDDRYRANTNLEQVSDWLTKIIVGVGLTKLSVIPRKLEGLAYYIAAGMRTGTSVSPSQEPFALAICLYFSSCGFLFGFLWARLYLGRAFRFADLREIAKQLRA